MDANLSAIVVATIAALGSVLAAWFSRKAARQSRTSNGATQGVLVERLVGDMSGVREDVREVSGDIKQLRGEFVSHLRDHATEFNRRGR